MGREIVKGKYFSKRYVEEGKKNEDYPNDSFLNSLNIGDSDSSGRQIRGFDIPEEIVDWFRSDRSDDWRQRD